MGIRTYNICLLFLSYHNALIMKDMLTYYGLAFIAIILYRSKPKEMKRDRKITSYKSDSALSLTIRSTMRNIRFHKYQLEELLKKNAIH